jgi:uncharacterized membrane protein
MESRETKQENEFYSLIGSVLRYGVLISFAVILLGSALLFAEGQTGYSPLGTLGQLVNNRDGALTGIGPIIQGVLGAKPYAIIDLGLLFLLATPLARVFVSIFLFLGEKRYVFVLITMAVLSLLIFSTFVLGPLLA